MEVTKPYKFIGFGRPCLGSPSDRIPSTESQEPAKSGPPKRSATGGPPEGPPSLRSNPGPGHIRAPVYKDLGGPDLRYTRDLGRYGSKVFKGCSRRGPSGHSFVLSVLKADVKIKIVILFLAGFRPNLAPRPL